MSYLLDDDDFGGEEEDEEEWDFGDEKKKKKAVLGARQEETKQLLNVPGAFSKVIFQRGNNLQVLLRLHVENRLKFCAAAREALPPPEDRHVAILFEGGKDRCRDDTDAEVIFRQESNFQYLFGVKEPGWLAAIDLETETTFLFAPRLPKEFAVWMGPIASRKALSERYGCQVRFTDEAEAFLKKRYDTFFCLQGVNSDSGTRSEGFPFFDDKEDTKVIGSPITYRTLAECRVHKSPQEQHVMRYACLAASEAHVAVMRSCQPGDFEFQLEARFLRSIYEFHGCRHAAYTSICACGPNSAVLHYGHAGAPNERQLQDGDTALLDMGAEYHCYCSDVTCSFPVNGTFSSKQRVVHEAVLDAQRHVIDALKPGASWVALHELAERTILRHLLRAGLLLLREDDDTEETVLDRMLEADLGAVFMPHGLGHLIGLDTHDVGGYLDGVTPARPTRPGKSKLRTARVLEADVLITVEPGCYFIDALLGPALENPATRAFFDVDVLNQYRGTGGVRLEDVVLVTPTGVANFTQCPRTVDEVQNVMAGGPWPPLADAAPYLRRQWGVFRDGRFHRASVPPVGETTTDDPDLGRGRGGVDAAAKCGAHGDDDKDKPAAAPSSSSSSDANGDDEHGTATGAAKEEKSA